MITIYTVYATFGDGKERRIAVVPSRWDAEDIAEDHQRRGMTTRIVTQ